MPLPAHPLPHPRGASGLERDRSSITRRDQLGEHRQVHVWTSPTAKKNRPGVTATQTRARH
eukprot:3245284-Prymnesium_polylepis.1